LGHFGNWGGKRLYGFALTLCWSRMWYVEFTQQQDAETLLNCMVHAFEFFGGVSRTLLTDTIKDDGCGPDRWAALLSSQDAGFCQLLRLLAAGLPSVPFF
jgi:transposase